MKGPRKVSQPDDVRLSLRLPRALWEGLQPIAHEEDRPLNWIICKAIRAMIRERGDYDRTAKQVKGDDQ